MNNKGKILILANEYYPTVCVGGLSKFVTGVSYGLRADGWKTKVFFPRHSSRIYFPFWTKRCHWQSQRLARQSIIWCSKNNWRPDWVWLNDFEGIYQSNVFRGFSKIIWTIHSPLSLAVSYGYGYTDDKPIDWSNDFFDFGAFIKNGIKNADLITTVSPTYSQSLKRLSFFEKAGNILGIENGVDKNEWKTKASSDWQDFKKISKILLQKRFRLPIKDIPVFIFVSRLVPQKGIDLLIKVLPNFLAQNEVQLIVVGKGLKKYEHFFENLKTWFPFKVGLRLKADFILPHQVFAGGDFLLLPSLTEPFGIVVGEARQCGVVPVVRAVDGLADQVKDENNGLSFKQKKASELERKLYQALKTWHSDWFWQTSLAGKNLIEDWEVVARKYGRYLLEANQERDSSCRRAKKTLFFS